MSLTNTTLGLVPVQFSSTVNEQIKCIFSIRLSLIIHFVVTTLLHLIFIYIFMGLLLGVLILFIGFPYFRGLVYAISPNIRLHSYAQEKRYSFIIVLFIKEMLLTFVYVLFAFLYRWLRLVNNDSSITSVNFRRWLIEGSMAPYLFAGIILEHYIGCLGIFFDQYQSFYIIGMILKIPLHSTCSCVVPNLNKIFFSIALNIF
jgi:hypothetical protein